MAKRKETEYEVYCCINGKVVTVEEVIQHLKNKRNQKQSKQSA